MGNARRFRRRLAGQPNGQLVDTRPAGVAALVAGRLNAYKCPACRGYTVIVQSSRGTTPMFLGCRAAGTADPDVCKGQAFSLGFPPLEAWPAGVPTQPAWEWYRPGEEELAQLRDSDPDGYQYVVAGGLLLRPYGHTPPTPAPPTEPVHRPAVTVTEQDLAEVDVAIRSLATQSVMNEVRP